VNEAEGHVNQISVIAADGPGNKPRVTICVLTYGPHFELAKRCVQSILVNCNRKLYRLFVGANAPAHDTEEFLNDLREKRLIDRLYVSVENVNKCPMMRQMFADVTTELIWWFDDDSFITAPDTLDRWLAVVDSTPESVVHWGHQFFYGHESDFSYDCDVVGFVKNAPWYSGKTPPSWKKGGKDEVDFQGRGTGDGRWFFITGGCWMIRTATIRFLDWPDPRLVKRNDDVFLSEAIRQQNFSVKDIGPLGVTINAAPRRGVGEDLETMQRQIRRPENRQPRSLEESKTLSESFASLMLVPPRSKGCVVLPTFEDTELLKENFEGRPELAAGIEFYVFDDNCERIDCQTVARLCKENNWHYCRSGRAKHGTFKQDQNDRSSWNYFFWNISTLLSGKYDYVIKVDTDSFLIDPNWHAEIDRLLRDRTAFAGTPEHRPSQDVMSFWEIAKKSGYNHIPGQMVMHVQGGISAYSKKALQKLRGMGFLHGKHIFFGEDCYMSYCCQLLGIPFLKTKTIGSWWQPYRPPLAEISHLQAIHPLSRSEWETIKAGTAGTSVLNA